MDSQPNASLSKEDLAHLAGEELKVVVQKLRETQRILARDWEKMTPRQRSAHSREARNLEQRQKELLQELELLGIEMTQNSQFS